MGFKRTNFRSGIYFSDSLDYVWYYADDSSNRKNFYIIPKINNSFSFIVVNAFYDKYKFDQVYDDIMRDIPVPDYGIRLVIVVYETAAILKDFLNYYNNKFKGTEYLISIRNQILPLLSVTVERVKYLIGEIIILTNQIQIIIQKIMIYKKIE